MSFRHYSSSIHFGPCIFIWRRNVSALHHRSASCYVVFSSSTFLLLLLSMFIFEMGHWLCEQTKEQTQKTSFRIQETVTVKTNSYISSALRQVAVFTMGLFCWGPIFLATSAANQSMRSNWRYSLCSRSLLRCFGNAAHRTMATEANFLPVLYIHQRLPIFHDLKACTSFRRIGFAAFLRSLRLILRANFKLGLSITVWIELSFLVA